MTLALVTTSLSPPALEVLEVDFGWKILARSAPSS